MCSTTLNRPSRSIWQLLLVATTLMVTSAVYADEDGWDDDDHHRDRHIPKLVIFGDSLSDTGNKFAVNGILNPPPYDGLNTFGVPSDPYAKGGPNFTDGKTWIELVARQVKTPQSAKAVLLGSRKAGNYAWGGAPAYAPPGDDAPMPLGVQVASYLADVNHDVQAETVHVIFIGGNDVIDALVMLAGGAPFTDAVNRVAGAAAAIKQNVNALVDAGARRFLILNTPNVGLIPAIGPSGKFITTCFAYLLNQASPGPSCPPVPIPFGIAQIAGELQASGAEVTTIDTFAFITELVDSGVAFGIDNVTDMCVMPNVAPFECETPNDYLFWDGIHPTKAAHRLLASVVINELGY